MAYGAKLATGCLSAGLLAALCACSVERNAAAGAGGNDSRPSHAREGLLDIVARAPDAGIAAATGAGWIGAFEGASSCKVRIRSTASSSELLATAAQGDADLVLAGGDVALSLVSAGRVRALDSTRIPSLAGLDPRLRALPGAVADGLRYGVPFQWQPNVLVYDTRAFAAPPASWSVLFEARPSSDDGEARLLAPAEPIALADAALYLRATQPGLRIADPFELDERQYAAALALLRRQKPALRGYWRNPAAQAEDFRNGVTVSSATPALVRRMQAQGLPVAWSTPAEGNSARVEIAMLHAGARHPNCAYAWLEWSLSPAGQAALASGAGALPVVAGACAQAPLAAEDACRRDGMDQLARVHFWKVPQARCGNGSCVPYSRWTSDYLALVGE